MPVNRRKPVRASQELSRRSRHREVWEISVEMPRAYPSIREVMVAIHRQTGLRYVITHERLAGYLGPCGIGRKVTLREIFDSVARRTNSTIEIRDHVAILQPVATDGGRASKVVVRASNLQNSDPDTFRHSAYALSQTRLLAVIPALMKLVSHPDPSVRRAALVGLASYEGDFRHEEWPGRISVFELVGSELDTDLLMWVMEDASKRGDRDWQAAVSILGRARYSGLPRSLWWAAWDKAPGTITAALWALGRCGDPDARTVLEHRMRDPATNSEVDRFVAGASLGQLGLVEALAKYVAADAEIARNPLVRCAAAYGLGMVPVAQRKLATDVLARMLHDADSRVREVAALSLGRMDCEETRNLLLSVAQNHEQDEGLRVAAALGLGEAGAVAELRELLDAKNSEVLVAAIAALDALGGFDPDRVRLLLDHPNRWVRLAAVKALAALGTDDAVGPVLELIQQTDTDSELRIAGVIGLGQGRAPAAASSLANIARDKQCGRRLRQYAIQSLGLLAERAGQPALQHIVEDCNTDTETRALALLYLDPGSADKTVSYLSYWLTHGAIHEQCCAAQRMAEIGTREAVYQLMAGFDVFSNITRSQHVIPLIENRSAAVTDALTDVLRSTRRAGVKVNCTIALAGRYAPHAVDELIKACGHSSPTVRAAAAQALGETGDPKAVDVLVRLLTEESEPRVVRQALRALRMRDFASNPKAEEALRAIAGTERDTGVPGGADIVGQEDHSWVLRHWAAHYEDETMPNLTYESSLTYDPVHRRVLQWGSHGRRYDSPQTGFTWEYSPDAGNGPAWSRPFSRQEVPGTCMTIGATAFDANRASLLVTKSAAGGHGWVFNLRKYLTLSTPWCYDARQKQWYPMRPLAPLGGTLGYYDRANDVAVFFANGRPQIYDLHSNTWTSLDSVQGPRVAVTPYAYDSRRNRVILMAGEDDKRRARTWAFDLQSQVFVELCCSNPPPPLHGPMIYDSHNDVMLVFNQTKDHMQVYAYHCAENRWERLPRIHPCPVYRNSAAAYDQFRNLVVLCGGEDSPTGSPQVRETWTYRYRASALQFEPQPAVTELKAIGNADGSVRLTWVFVGKQPAKGFDVYRGTGPHPWVAEFRKLNDKAIKQCAYEDRDGQPAAECIYYRVSAVDEAGHELASSYVGRTQPPVIREVWCSIEPSGRIRLEWLPSDREDVIGYNVYAAEVAPFDPWTEPFSIPGRDAFKKLNATPLRETAYLAKVSVHATSELGERQWPDMYAFYVTAVGSAGLESGPSPVALSMAGEPGPVLCVQMPDGRSLIVSGRSRSAPLAGYHLLRMDCYHNAFAYRTTAAPLASSVLLDWGIGPRRDRRVYFAVPVDCIGQLGIPSSEIWAINSP